uniref:Thiol peroxidase n=1 Tax=candidate division WOR-3 bacterium TaxID=2052148 RepID=A0A7C4CD08_UNCW3
MQRTGASVTIGGTTVKLEGSFPKVGEAAPEFSVVGNDLAEVKLSQFRGRPVVIASVPSLDTAVCDIEARRFNAEAVGLGRDLAVMVVSMDLPFAQKRWCGQAGVDRVVTVSDHRTAGFGQTYGVLIKEMRLLARAVFVVDREGVLRYSQLVPDVGSEPDYAAVLEAVRAVV